MTNQVKIQTITPAIAQAWLENKFEGQRRIRDAHVHRMASDMKLGKWNLSNDAITLIDGKLANGQHRCQAVVLSKKNVPMMVLHTDNKDLFDYMDGGVIRTIEDNLVQDGFKYAFEISAGVRRMLDFQKGFYSWNGRATKKEVNEDGIFDVVTKTEILDFARKNKKMLEKHAAMIRNLYDEQRIVSPSIILSFLLIVPKKNEKRALDFIQALYLGNTNDIIHDLREKYIKNNSAVAKFSRYFMFGLMLKSFNAWIAGERPQLRVGTKEEYPRLS